jgi:hypothetical protein
MILTYTNTTNPLAPQDTPVVTLRTIDPVLIPYIDACDELWEEESFARARTAAAHYWDRMDKRCEAGVAEATLGTRESWVNLYAALAG